MLDALKAARNVSVKPRRWQPAVTHSPCDLASPPPALDLMFLTEQVGRRELGLQGGERQGRVMP